MRRLQERLGRDGGIELLTFRCRHRAEGTGRYLRILGADRIETVVGEGRNISVSADRARSHRISDPNTSTLPTPFSLDTGSTI